MKNKMVSVAVVFVLIIAVVISVKSGKLNIINNTPKEIVQAEDDENTSESSGEENQQAGQSKEYTDEEIESIVANMGQAVIDVTDADGKVVERRVIRDKSMNNAKIINPGEEAIYENIKVGLKEKTLSESSKYNIKYIKCEISQEKPSAIEMNFYPMDDKELYCDENDRFLDETYYYVTVTYEITNLFEEEWENYGYPMSNAWMGYYDENGFTNETDASGHLTNVSDVNGVIYLDKNETATINSCYIVSAESLKSKKMAVQIDASGDKNRDGIPYLAINTDVITK